MIEVTLYSRQDCHLCEQVQADLSALQTEVPHRLTIVDVDSSPKLRKEFGFEVPVVQAGPYQLKAPITRQDLLITLKSAEQRLRQITKIEQDIESGKITIPMEWTVADRFSLWLSRHYLAVFNIFVFLYVGIPFLAPILMKVGATGAASIIYRGYNVVCHELAFRSWFLFGEQPFYPRSAAGIEGVISYGEATGMNEQDLWAARRYEGNERIGYKVALCQRDVAIYGGILLFGILFAISKRRLGSLHWLVWIILGVLPVGLDGVSQLISQPPLNLLPFRESTPLLRTLTGGLFGFMTAWFGYPMVEISMKDTRQFLETKLRRVQQRLNRQDLQNPRRTTQISTLSKKE